MHLDYSSCIRVYYSKLAGVYQRCTWTIVLVFAVLGSFFILRVAPVVPTCRCDVAAHLAIHEEGLGVWAPRTTQIYLVNTHISCQLALVEDIAVFLTSRAGCGCDVTACLAVNLTILKPCQARTEHEIGGSLNVAVVEGDAGACLAGINGILITQKTAVLYQHMVALNVE